jgi:hypothetical protein
MPLIMASTTHREDDFEGGEGVVFWGADPGPHLRFNNVYTEGRAYDSSRYCLAHARVVEFAALAALEAPE